MKKQKALYNQIRGLITDVNINVNAGNPTFKNFTLTSIGKLDKRKGWSVIRGYGEVLGAETDKNQNITIDYNRLNTGVGGYPNVTCFHLKPYTTVVNGNETTYKDVLVHRIVNNVNELYRIRYDVNDAITEQVKISTPQGWTGKGNVKFIETPDNVYIVTDFKDDKSYSVMKYKYNKDVLNGDYDVLYSLTQYPGIKVNAQAIDFTSVQSNFIVNGVLIPNRLTKQSFRYMVLPVYNTGTIASFDPLITVYKETGASYKLINPNVTLVNNGNPVGNRSNTQFPSDDISDKCIQLTLDALNIDKDPFITHYRIYRTKKLDLTMTEVADLNDANNWDFYFLAQVKRTGGNTIIFYDTIPDEELTNKYISDSSYNTLKALNLKYDATYNTGTAKIEYSAYSNNPKYLDPETNLDVDAGIRGTCGTYAQNRLFIGGNRKYPKLGYISDIDKTDNFSLVPYSFELAGNDNEIIAIEEVGNNIYWFLQHSIYVLRPTSDPLAPYTKELISPTIGCDSLNSICVLEGIAYFMFNNKLMALNAFGQYNEVSIPVNSKLNNLDTASPCEVIIKANASDRYIKIMYRDTDNKPININYCPVTDIFEEEDGYKDIFTVSGSTATLTVKDDRYGLLNYEQIPDLKEEWGVDIDGNIVKRATDYVNTSIGGDKQGWIDYPTVVKSQEPIKTYTVESILDKPFVFASRVLVNSVTLYGLGDIDVAWSIDDGAFSGFRTVAMTRTGVELPLNRQGFIINVRLRHNKNENVDYDYMEVKYTAQTSVDIRNNVTGGTAV